jgi:hypothetical protein
MMRKLSVTRSQSIRQFLGTLLKISRRLCANRRAPQDAFIIKARIMPQ